MSEPGHPQQDHFSDVRMYVCVCPSVYVYGVCVCACMHVSVIWCGKAMHCVFKSVCTVSYECVRVCIGVMRALRTGVAWKREVYAGVHISGTLEAYTAYT